MFIKNATDSCQSFAACGINVFLKPKGQAGDTIQLDTTAAKKDDIIALLLAKGVIEEIGKTDAVKKIEADAIEKATKEEEAKPEVKVIAANANQENDVVIVKCCANKSNGEPCQKNVKVPRLEYDAAKPYFCGTHKNEDQSDYEKVDGEWVKHK